MSRRIRRLLRRLKCWWLNQELHLYSVDADGDMYAFAAISEEEAIRLFQRFWMHTTGEPYESPWEEPITAERFPDTVIIGIGGDEPEKYVPKGGTYDPKEKVTRATPKQWMQFDEQHRMPIFSSVF